MSRFERFLSLWVALCMIGGVLAGQIAPSLFQNLAALEVAQVNLPIAALIWLMIIPMLAKIDFRTLPTVRNHWRGMSITFFVNWAVKPFSMALLAGFFLKYLFAKWLPPGLIDSYIAGLILLAAAPCTAMVFVWSQLTEGEPLFTLSQVALNDLIMMFAFAPLVALLLGLSNIEVPWNTLFLSVALYIVVPVLLGQLLRFAAQRFAGEDGLHRLLRYLSPVSIAALLLTLLLLFGLQGNQLVSQPVIIAMLAVPILIQVIFTASLAYLLNWWSGESHCVAGPSALIGASNFFELAVAAAIGLFGLNSGAALATVVGVLVEVPIMLAVVSIVNRTKPWYERRTFSWLSRGA